MTSTIEKMALAAIREGQDDAHIEKLLFGAPLRGRQLERLLFLAIDWKRTRLVRALINAGADVNASRGSRQEWGEMTPLMAASCEDKPEIVRLLLKAGARPNVAVQSRDECSTALRCAIRYGTATSVQELLKGGADPNFSSPDIPSAPILCFAIEDEFGEPQDNPEIVRLLLQYGAAIDMLDAEHQSALYLAARSDLAQVTAVLLDYEPDPNLADNWGYTALHQANDAAVVRMLLQGGAPVNAQTQYGETALMLAILNENEEKTRLLLENGADYLRPQLAEDYGGFGGTAAFDLARFVAREAGNEVFLDLLAFQESRRILLSMSQRTRLGTRK